jgi:hypothetical protein
MASHVDRNSSVAGRSGDRMLVEAILSATVWPTHPPCNGYRVPFPAVRRPGRGANNPPTSSAEVKEKVELYLLSPSGPTRPVLGQTWPLPWPHIGTSPHYSRYTIFRVNFWSIPKLFFSKQSQYLHVFTQPLFELFDRVQWNTLEPTNSSLNIFLYRYCKSKSQTILSVIYLWFLFET